MIFFVVEGEYTVSDQSKRGNLYGENAFMDEKSTFQCNIAMKTHGKIAYTTLH